MTEAGGTIKVYEQPDGHNLGDDTFTKYMDKVHVSKAESMAKIWVVKYVYLPSPVVLITVHFNPSSAKKNASDNVVC